MNSNEQECPVCFKYFLYTEIQHHVELCLSGAIDPPKEELVCEFCSQPFPLDKFYFLLCDHPTCIPCVKSFIVNKINENKCSEIVCPNSDCKKPIGISDIKFLLHDPELIEKYQNTSIQEYISSSANFIKCPNCDFAFEKTVNHNINQNEVVLGEDGNPISKESLIHRGNFRFRCNNCNTEFCAGCKHQPYHLGFTCETYASYLESKHCRFCEVQLKLNNTAPDIFIDSLKDVCTDNHCTHMREIICDETLPCGHGCCGRKGEHSHPPCVELKCLQELGDSNEHCVICYSKYRYEPTIALYCGHMYHFDCIKTRIEGQWTGALINFEFLLCPLCKQMVIHPDLDELIKPSKDLHSIVRDKALERFKYMKLDDAEEIKDKSSVYYNNPEKYSMARFCYYQCYKCKQPYFGGMKECNAEQRVQDFNHKDLICGSCSSQGGKGDCLKHGSTYVEYKCRFCCNVACWFCWGTTHFCNDCHNIAAQISKKPKSELPQCTCNVKHPPNGEEFCLGCSVCRFEMDI